MSPADFAASAHGSGIQLSGSALAVIIIAVCGVAVAIWRFSVLKSGGLNPFVARQQLEARLARSRMMAPATPHKGVEQRLAEVNDLNARGVITAEEHAAARAKIISGDYGGR